MRPLPLLGLLCGLAMLGWGGYSLYARFLGGPEVYWDKEKAESLDTMEKTLGEMKVLLESEQVQIPDLRRQIETMPAGAKREELGQRLDELTADAATHAEVIQKSEEILEKSRTFRDEAKGRALRRGILFTLLGLAWSVRAGMAVLSPSKRRPVAPPSTGRPGVI